MKGRPMMEEDYQNSPVLVASFRLFDCSLETDVAAAVIVTSARNAHRFKKPVYIVGIATGHSQGPDDLISRTDLLNMGITQGAPRAFEMAEFKYDEIDFAEIYDCFTFIVLRQVEEMGFSERGEAPEFVKADGSPMEVHYPINIHGGFLLRELQRDI